MHIKIPRLRDAHVGFGIEQSVNQDKQTSHRLVGFKKLEKKRHAINVWLTILEFQKTRKSFRFAMGGGREQIKLFRLARRFRIRRIRKVILHTVHKL